MTQHAFRCEDHQRLAPRAANLPAQQMKILRSGRRLANLHVLFAGQLHEALDARAGMLGSLAFITVWQKQNDARRKVPLILASADELIDDDLRPIYKVAELRFPQN